MKLLKKDTTKSLCNGKSLHSVFLIALYLCAVTCLYQHGTRPDANPHSRQIARGSSVWEAMPYL